MNPLTFFLRALTLALVLAGLALVVFGHPGAGLALAVSPLLAVAFAPDPRPQTTPWLVPAGTVVAISQGRHTGWHLTRRATVAQGQLQGERVLWWTRDRQGRALRCCARRRDLHRPNLQASVEEADALELAYARRVR